MLLSEHLRHKRRELDLVEEDILAFEARARFDLNEELGDITYKEQSFFRRWRQAS